MKFRKCLFWTYIIAFTVTLHLFKSVLYMTLSDFAVPAILFGTGVVIAIAITIMPAAKPFFKNQEGSERRFILSLCYTSLLVLDYLVFLMQLFMNWKY